MSKCPTCGSILTYSYPKGNFYESKLIYVCSNCGHSWSDSDYECDSSQLDSDDLEFEIGTNTNNF